MTFSWNESEWIRRERRDDSIEFAGGSPITLSLSHYGRELAVGRPYFPADLSGQIQTFEFPRTNCDEGFERFRITVTIQPTVTRWNLTSLTQDASFESTGGGPCFFPNFPGAANVAVTHRDGATVVEELCVPEQQCGNFTLYPPGFGGAAFLLNQETRVVEWENDDVLNRWIGTVDPSACEAFVEAPRRKKRSIDGRCNATSEGYDDDLFYLGDNATYLDDDGTN